MLPFKYLYDYTDFFLSLLCILKFNILKTIYYLYKFVDWELSTFRLSIFRLGISKIVQ